MVIGVAIGGLLPDGPNATGFRATDLEILSTLFLRMVKSMIAPLIFGTLVVGIAGHGDDLRKVGTLAFRSMIYFEVVTTLALVVGLVAVNVVRPGRGIDMGGATAEAGVTLAGTQPSWTTLIERSVPQSIVEAAAKNEVLPIVVFAILFGVGLARVGGAGRTLMLSICESLSAVMFQCVNLVMACAPIGIGAAIAVTVGRNGFSVLTHLGLLVATLYGALIMFAVVVLLPIAVICRVPLRRFWQAAREPWLLAFTSASSEVALPLALRNLERLGVPRRIAAFVLPAGYAFNMDGTALYLALASVFVAQSAGIAMPVSQQLMMLLTLTLTSKGIAAVPRTSLVVLAGTLTQFGLPLQGVALILGVDVLMDMARTSVNVVGNCLAAVAMARWDGSFALTPDDELVAS
jgi:Na+/H+-dicarboxylate symporter